MMPQKVIGDATLILRGLPRKYEGYSDKVLIYVLHLHLITEKEMINMKTMMTILKTILVF